MNDSDIGQISALLSEFSTRVNDLEENLRLIKERLYVMSQTVLTQNTKNTKEFSIMRDDISSLRQDIEKIKESSEHIVEESAEFARKEELRILERQIKLFDPLKFTTEEDVKRIIKKVHSEKGIIKVEEE
jgi:hypothetical protein